MGRLRGSQNDGSREWSTASAAPAQRPLNQQHGSSPMAGSVLCSTHLWQTRPAPHRSHCPGFHTPGGAARAAPCCRYTCPAACAPAPGLAAPVVKQTKGNTGGLGWRPTSMHSSTCMWHRVCPAGWQPRSVRPPSAAARRPSHLDLLCAIRGGGLGSGRLGHLGGGGAGGRGAAGGGGGQAPRLLRLPARRHQLTGPQGHRFHAAGGGCRLQWAAGEARALAGRPCGPGDACPHCNTATCALGLRREHGTTQGRSFRCWTAYRAGCADASVGDR